MADRYRAALDMAEWADGLGAVAITLSEHHGSPDGYLPSALTMAAAMAARTKHARLMIAAVVAPPPRPPSGWPRRRRWSTSSVVAASDLCLVNGYVAEWNSPCSARTSPGEGGPRHHRRRWPLLRGAWTGGPFEYRGRTVSR